MEAQQNHKNQYNRRQKMKIQKFKMMEIEIISCQEELYIQEKVLMQVIMLLLQKETKNGYISMMIKYTKLKNLKQVCHISCFYRKINLNNLNVLIVFYLLIVIIIFNKMLIQLLIRYIRNGGRISRQLPIDSETSVSDL